MRQLVTDQSYKIQKKFGNTRINPNKKVIEDFFISTARKHLQLDKCLVISGPQYTRHVNKLMSYGAREIYIAEIETGIFQNDIMSQAQSCPYYLDGKVSLLNVDIGDIAINGCNYIDLDLMKTLKSILPAIEYQMENQIKTVTGLKAFTFTFSNRSTNREKLLTQFHKKMFGAQVGMIKSIYSVPPNSVSGRWPSRYCHNVQTFLSAPGTLIDAKVFHYADTSPMASVMYIYF